jgi:hypothetical protein
MAFLAALLRGGELVQDVFNGGDSFFGH